MTMRITITNEDQSRTARVELFDKVRAGTPDEPPPVDEPPHVAAETAQLAPGQSGEFWIHDSRYAVVTEI